MKELYKDAVGVLSCSGFALVFIPFFIILLVLGLVVALIEIGFEIYAHISKRLKGHHSHWG